MSKLLCVSLIVLGVHAARSETNALTLVRTISLPDISGRLDHLAADARRNRVFLAALENNTVEVVDFKTGKHVETLHGCNKPQGVLYSAKPNFLYVAAGGDGQVKIFDCDSFRTLKTVGSLPDADNLRFDAPANRVYVGFGNGSLGVINAMSGVHTYDIPLSGHPESFQIERNGGRIFVNVPEAGHIAVVDRPNRTVAAKWAIQSYQGNFPMALDEESHRLFVAYRKPPKLTVLDATSGKAVADVEISGDADDLFFDAKHRRAFVICGEGFVYVVEARDGDHFQRVEKTPTRRGARTGLYISEPELLCVAVPAANHEPAELRIFSVKP